MKTRIEFRKRFPVERLEEWIPLAPDLQHRDPSL